MVDELRLCSRITYDELTALTCAHTVDQGLAVCLGRAGDDHSGRATPGATCVAMKCCQFKTDDQSVSSLESYVRPHPVPPRHTVGCVRVV